MSSLRSDSSTGRRAYLLAHELGDQRESSASSVLLLRTVSRPNRHLLEGRRDPLLGGRGPDVRLRLLVHLSLASRIPSPLPHPHFLVLASRISMSPSMISRGHLPCFAWYSRARPEMTYWLNHPVNSCSGIFAHLALFTCSPPSRLWTSPRSTSRCWSRSATS